MRRLWLCIPLLACASNQPRPEPTSGSAVPSAADATSTATVPPAAPHLDDTRVEDWQGMRIVVRRRPKAELVTTELVIRGGLTTADPATAGLERLALSTAAFGGTERSPKSEFQGKLARLGSTIDARTDADGSALEAKALRDSWGETFDLLTEAFLHPALPTSELELQRRQQLAALAQLEENPDLLLSDLARRTVFEGTPYALRTLGTKESVAALTRQDAARQLEAMRVRNRLLLVVVGDLDPELVISRAKTVLGGLPAGPPLPLPVARPAFTAPRVNALQRPLPTNYVLALAPAPSWSDPDFVPALVGMEILGDREFEEIRTKRNLTYAVGAALSSRYRLPLANLYVTAVDPPTTLRAMLDEVRRLQQTDIEPERLAGAIAELRTGWLMEGESTSGEAQQLVRAELLGGDWRLQRQIPDRFPQVTGGQVKSYARRWLANWQVAVVGDPAKVDVSLFR